MDHTQLVPPGFRQIELLGQGRTGAAYLVEERAGGALFVLKRLSRAYSREALDVLRQEFATLKHLYHPCLCAVKDFAAAPDGTPYLLREFMPGRPLAGGPPRAGVDPARYLRPVLDVLATLSFLHLNGIAHLDLHPGNVIERPDGTGGLIDVGVFPPRERTAEARAGREASDLYAVGLLLLRRLTGTEKPAALLSSISDWDARTVLRLEHVVSRAASTDAGAAFKSAEEFLHVLCDVFRMRPETILAPGESHRFVGQRAALAAVERCLAALGAGRAATLWAYGAPGSGKSRLLAEARAGAELRGLRACAFRCFANAPFSPAEFGRLAFGTSAFPSTAAREPEALAREFLRLAREAGGGLLVTVDDLQNADRLGKAFVLACLELLAHGVEAPLGIVVADNAAPGRNGVPAARLAPLRAHEAEQVLSQLLFPLAIEADRCRAIIALTKGAPKLLHRAARALKRLGGGDLAPDRTRRVDIAAIVREGAEVSDPAAKRLLGFLGVFARPVGLKELSVASGLGRSKVKDALGALAGLVALEHGARSAAYSLASDSLGEDVTAALSARERTRMHRACAAAMAAAGRRMRDASAKAGLVRHLILAGALPSARRCLDAAVSALRAEGNAGTACRLVALLFEHEKNARRRMRLVTTLSDLARQSGQDEIAVDALTRVLPRLRGRARLGVAQRLGVHLLKLGREKQALALFEEVRGLADPVRDREELVDLEAEMADLFILRGDFAAAEDACRRGLGLVEGLAAGDSVRKGEMMLRGIAGRLQLRRLALEEAIREFRRALGLARATDEPGPRALLLNNIAVAYNQRNDFARARAAFRAAERLSRRLGHADGLLHIACNLAVVAAKTGDAAEARAELARAQGYLADVPGERSRFLVAQTATFVHAALGEASRAAAEARKAIALGTSTGDVSHVCYVELYHVDALIDEGRYHAAEALVRRILGRQGLLPVQRRMAQARLALLCALLGRRTAARAALEALAAGARTSIEYLEAANDCIAGLACEHCGDDGRALLHGARAAFVRLGIPFGVARGTVALLLGALAHRDDAALRPLLTRAETPECGPHARLDIERPLACAEACLALGETERARQHLFRASCANVGTAFPELDLRLETVSAALAAVGNDLPAARQHVHRALTLRKHLAEALGEKARRAFLGQTRWRTLNELEESLFQAKSPAAASAAAQEETFGLAAHSPAMREVLRLIRVLGPQELSVLIRGPSGSGKDLVAAALHAASPRRGGHFLTVHVPSLQTQLLESELFGYAQGAFTGAEKDRPGLLQAGSGGTVLLDEIASLDLESQAKVLRVLDRREVRPLGGSEVVALDVRFLFSTAKDLARLVAQGAFREDLYWRIVQAEIVVPPLSQRKEDIPELVAALLRKHARLGRPAATLEPDVARVLAERKWPGNVRQLETVLVRAMLAGGENGALSRELLEHAISSPSPVDSFPDDVLERDDLQALERELEIAWLKRRFTAAGGSMSALARALSVTRAGLYAWFKRLGVNPEAWRA